MDAAAGNGDPWYHDGLKFSCTRCGNCCTGKPGIVWINEQEILDIAQLLGVSTDEVRGLYTRPYFGKRTLKEKANDDCIFWDATVGCTVYPARPRQCRTWPFWESNLHTPADWERTAAGCPGCNQGELIPVEEITRRLKVIRM